MNRRNFMQLLGLSSVSPLFITSISKSNIRYIRPTKSRIQGLSADYVIIDDTVKNGAIHYVADVSEGNDSSAWIMYGSVYDPKGKSHQLKILASGTLK